MNKNIIISVLIASSLASFPAWAVNAKPLGLELGVATYDQVKQQIGSKTSLVDSGINSYSDGKMLHGDGSGLGVDGLSDITFIFDRTNKLAGVLMTLPKENGMGDLNDGYFRKTLSALQKKYKLIKKAIPFVGDSSAELSQGNSVIELNAPHMSFNMTLDYLTQDMERAYRQKSTQKNQQHQQQQDSNF